MFRQGGISVFVPFESCGDRVACQVEEGVLEGRDDRNARIYEAAGG